MQVRDTPPKELLLAIYLPSQLDVPVVFIIDLELDPPESVAHEGILNDIPLGKLEVGEAREFALGLCFLSTGRFEISAQVRPFAVAHLETRIAHKTLTAFIGES